MNKNKIYIYYHNDHDGIVAAGILYNHIKNDLHSGLDKYEIILIMIDYDQLLNFDHINFEDGDEVYFLDYSFSNDHNKKEFEKLLKRRKGDYDVVWIDHHKSSIGLFGGYYIDGVRNSSLCGAAWTYLWVNAADDGIFRTFCNATSEDRSDIFHSCELIPKFLKYIDDYDCWKGKYLSTNNFHYGLTISSPKDSIISYLLEDNKFASDKIHDIIETGKEIQKYLQFENKEYHVNMYGFEYTLPEEHGGLKCFCLNRKGNSLMFGDKINEYDAVIPFFYVNGKWKYSIFSNKEHIDCSEIAKTYGGGGHKGAAGWVTDKLIF